MPRTSLTETVLLPELELTKYYRYSLSISLSARKANRKERKQYEQIKDISI